MTTTLFIANRAVIARRVARTARNLGMRIAACYSDVDRDALYVRESDVAVHLPGTRAVDTYLDIPAVVAAARSVGADLVHPGYGFLSENADFAQACADAGLGFVGPSAEAIRLMGSKIEAKVIAKGAGVPILESVAIGSGDPVPEDIPIAFPLLVKPSAGGGGKGMRLVESPGALADAIAGARRESASSFADQSLMLEPYVSQARHIEVQVAVDGSGRAVHFGERECSVQRRQQKIIEESPAPQLTGEVREHLLEAAVRLATSIDYLGVGTVEFLVCEDQFWFLEMNTRLQVEHAVTEERCGVDLVALQLDIARGGLVPDQAGIAFSGAAVEARIYAEDVARGFLPMSGRVGRHLHEPAAGLRYETSLESGMEVSPFYDPMLAKMIGTGSTREQAIDRLVRGLTRTRVLGLTTNIDYLIEILDDPDFRRGETFTSFVKDHPGLGAEPIAGDLARELAIAAAVHRTLLLARCRPVPAGIPLAWRGFGRSGPTQTFAIGDCAIDVLAREISPGTWNVEVDGSSRRVRVSELDADDRLTLEIDGQRKSFEVFWRDEAAFVATGAISRAKLMIVHPGNAAESVRAISYEAPMPGSVTAVEVAEGEQVKPGDVLVVLEAMKMEHRIVATHPGTVGSVHVAPGNSVAGQSVLVTMAAPGEPDE